MSPKKTTVLLIEDELPAAKRLEKLVCNLDPGIEILDVIDSVEDAVAWFEENEKPSLVFMDIQLADGLSFQIFEKTEVKVPVIFTTAYDQYALKAFKVNSIDYLLKPIDQGDLEAAWSKFQENQLASASGVQALLTAFQGQMKSPAYKKRFLVKVGEQYKYIQSENIAYFFSDSSLTFLVDQNGQKLIVDHKLDQLMQMLDPAIFFRLNRKFIIQDSAISKISTYFNSRLKLELNPVSTDEVIVSRERVQEFKAWLDR